MKTRKIISALLFTTFSLCTITVTRPSFSQAQQPAIQNVVDTPITLLAKDNNTFTAEQKFQIYQDCARFFLDNVRKNHPNLLPQLTPYFNAPQAAYDRESSGFHNFKASIE